MAHAPATDDPFADLRACRDGYRRFALENPTYYAVMFDRVFPDFEPSERAERAAIDALGGLAARVQRAIDAGSLKATNAWLVAAGVGSGFSIEVTTGVSTQVASTSWLLSSPTPCK
jgi:hypothetical protein